MRGQALGSIHVCPGGRDIIPRARDSMAPHLVPSGWVTGCWGQAVPGRGLGGCRVHGVCAHPTDCHPRRVPARRWAGTWRAPTTRASCPTTTTATTTLTRASSRTSPARPARDWEWGGSPPHHSPPHRPHGEGSRHRVQRAQAPASPTPLPALAVPFAPGDAAGDASAPAPERPPPVLSPVPSAYPQHEGSAPSQAHGMEGDGHAGEGGLGEQRGPGDAEHAGGALGFLRVPSSPPLLTPPGWGSLPCVVSLRRETCLEQLPPSTGTTTTPSLSCCRAGQCCRAPL